MNKKQLSTEQIYQKIENYCAYQDRCIQEVKKKLTQWNCSNIEQEPVIKHLIQTKFIDEQRFAQEYASGKFRIKKWGKYKIKHHLSLKNIPSTYITEAIKDIDQKEYLQTIRILINKKREQLEINKNNEQENKQKIINYLIGKGYEYPLIEQELENERR